MRILLSLVAGSDERSGELLQREPRGNDAVEVAVADLAAGVALADATDEQGERAYREIAVPSPTPT
ncbi:hypothetical protein ACFVWG_12610 [Kribbella sp. NPDC058245]|uniref:hypothetical protein n=1 Tax=Kribbella sp. NPDC058245 TaxID=3346399 RepID=UPI0036E7ED31